MVDLVLSNSDSSKRSKAHSSSCLQKPFGRLISSWKTLWSGIQESIRSRSLYEVWEKINQFKDADKFLYTNLPEKNQFAEMFREYLKSKFAEAGVFLDKKKSNLSNLLYSEDKSPVRLLARLVLLYCYLCGVKGFPWTFQELETAQLINFVFHCNELNTIPATFFVFKVFHGYTLDLDQKLNPEEVVKHIEQRVVSYILREVHGNFGLLRIYFLFFKDNGSLKEHFFSRIKTEMLCKETRNTEQKELIEILNKLPFAVEFLVSLADKGDIVKNVFQKCAFELTGEYIKKLTEEFEENSTDVKRLVTRLSKELDFEERYDVRVSLSSNEMDLMCNLYVEDLVSELIEEIRNIGRQLISQKTFEKGTLLSKIAGVFYLVELSKKVEFGPSINAVSQLIEAPERMHKYLSAISKQNFIVNSLEGCSHCFKRLVNELSEFLTEKEKILEEVKNLKIEDKPEILKEYRKAISKGIKKYLGCEVFSDGMYGKEIHRWKNLESGELKSVIEAVDAGKHERLAYVLKWNWYYLGPSFCHKIEEKVLLKMAYFYYLIKYVEEKQNEKAYQVIKEVLRKKLPIWGYAYFFDDCPDDLELLQKMRWLSFVLDFLLDLRGVECKWKEKEQLLRLKVETSLLDFESFLMFLIFPDVEYIPARRFHVNFTIEPEDIFKFLQDLK
ncbi:MAG: hypothetical protein QXL75_02390 [archaeon]